MRSVVAGNRYFHLLLPLNLNSSNSSLCPGIREKTCFQEVWESYSDSEVILSYDLYYYFPLNSSRMRNMRQLQCGESTQLASGFKLESLPCHTKLAL